MSAAPGRPQASSHRSAQGEGTLMSGSDDRDGDAALQVRIEGAVCWLTLNRPARGNALSDALVARLQAAIDAACARPGTRLLVLQAEGRQFCTGFDLSDLERETDNSLLARFARIELMLQSLHRAPFETLAVAHGRTMGAGADLFCACVHRWIVGGQTMFAFPGSGFGLVLGTGRLADLVGSSQARAWVQGGAPFDAQQALAHGLVQRHLAPDAVPAAVQDLAGRAQRVDGPTSAAIHAVLQRARRPRGDAGDAADLAALVRSAARPGLRERIAHYQRQQAGRRSPAGGTKGAGSS